MRVKNLQQGEQIEIYLLWESDGERTILFDVYTNKVQAEADLRAVRDDPRYAGRGYTYIVTTRHTAPHDNNR